jgi:hypothetical protein
VKKNHIDADAIGFKSMPQIDEDGRVPKEKTNDEAKVAAGGFENKIVHEADLIDGRLHQEVAFHPMPSLFPCYNHDTQGTIHASRLHLNPNDSCNVAQVYHPSQYASWVDRPSLGYAQHGQQHMPFTMKNEVPVCHPHVLNSMDYAQHGDLQLQLHYNNKAPAGQPHMRDSMSRPMSHVQRQDLQQHKPFTMENEVPACQPHVLNSVGYAQQGELQHSAFTMENELNACQPNGLPYSHFNWQMCNDINGMDPNQAVKSFHSAPWSNPHRSDSCPDFSNNVDKNQFARRASCPNRRNSCSTMSWEGQVFGPNDNLPHYPIEMMQLQQPFRIPANDDMNNHVQQWVPSSVSTWQEQILYPQSQEKDQDESAQQVTGPTCAQSNPGPDEPTSYEYAQFLQELASHLGQEDAIQ